MYYVSVFPRIVPSDYRFRPYYDFRNEKNGATLTGVVNLPSVPEKMYHIHEKWDLSEMPKDARAVSIGGEGDHDYIGKTFDYLFKMSAVGKISEHISYDGQVKIYWLNEPLPDKERILKALPLVYKSIAEFFEDPEAPYTIFSERIRSKCQMEQPPSIMGLCTATVMRNL